MSGLRFEDTLIDLGPVSLSGTPTLRIEATPRGAHLARALAGSEGEPEVEGPFFIVPYDRGMDGRLCDLIDVLIAVRYAHPGLLQLRLELDASEAR